jgi:hypothetical protein
VGAADGTLVGLTEGALLGAALGTARGSRASFLGALTAAIAQGHLAWEWRSAVRWAASWAPPTGLRGSGKQ